MMRMSYYRGKNEEGEGRKEQKDKKYTKGGK